MGWKLALLLGLLAPVVLMLLVPFLVFWLAWRLVRRLPR